MSNILKSNPLKPVILSGFADEAANQKKCEQQFCAFAALGLRYYTLRFIDAGAGIQNVMQLARRACELANTFDSKLIRGFSFYHPRGTAPEDHLNQAIDQLGQIARVCNEQGLTFGLEVEANLIGQTGKLLKRLYDGVADPAMVLIFDGANLVCQGMSTEQVYEEYLAMKEGLGWLHVKDYQRPLTRSSHVDEDSLKSFVPADQGDSGHEAIFRDIKRGYSDLLTRLEKRGIPGLFMDLEPHVKGGGQFGGFSGPDGFGVALRGLCRVLDYVGLPYDLRSFDDIRNSVSKPKADA